MTLWKLGVALTRPQRCSTRFDEMLASKVSVCVPTYNGARHLVACFESIQSQSLSDFEVVIVDDNSTDETLAVARAFAARDPRFRIFLNPATLGLAQNWNRSIELSSGDWIKLLFQDDLMHPTCLERLVDECERWNCAFGFCRRKVLFERDVAPEWRRALAEHRTALDAIYAGRTNVNASAFATIWAENPGVNLAGEPTATLFRRSVTQEIGWFEPSLVQLTDAEYWCRLGANFGVVHVPEELATFRVHAGSATSQNLMGRKYRKEFLDPLIQKYLILRRPYYSQLRRALWRDNGVAATWWGCMYNANRAWKLSKEVQSRAADESVAAEWRRVVSAFPIFPVLAILFSLLDPLRRTIDSLRRVFRGRRASATRTQEPAQ